MWAAAWVLTQARRYAETPAPRLLFVLQVPYILLLWQLYTSASVKMVLIYVTAEGPRSENFSPTPTEQPEKKTSASLCVLPLTASEYQMCCCWGLRVRKKKKQSESAHQRGKEKKKRFFFEEDKSPVHKEVINICMTEQMTAYFHGNTLVSPEMSAGDRSRLLWASVWLLTESPAPLDCRSQNTSKLEREREFTQVIVSALMWTRCHCCFFYCSQGKRALFICKFKEAVFSSVCRVCGCANEYVWQSKKKKINYCATAWGVLECRSERPQGPSLQLVAQKSSLVVFLTNFLFFFFCPFHFF